MLIVILVLMPLVYIIEFILDGIDSLTGKRDANKERDLEQKELREAIEQYHKEQQRRRYKDIFVEDDNFWNKLPDYDINRDGTIQ